MIVGEKISIFFTGRGRFLSATIFFLLIYLLFGRFLSIGFLSDDFHFLSAIKGQQNPLSYFLTNNVGEKSGGSYGPILDLWWIIQYKIFGLSAYGYHAVNLLLLGLSAFVLFLFTEKTVGVKAAIISALIFVFLPGHTESAAWIAVQPHLWAGFLAILSLYGYALFLSSDKKIWYGLSLLAFFLALFTKESVLFVPILIVLLEWRDNRGAFLLTRARKTFIRILPFLGTVALFMFLRYRVVGYLFGYYGAALDLAWRPKAASAVELVLSLIVSWPSRFYLADFLEKNWWIFLILGFFLLSGWGMLKRKRRDWLSFLALGAVISILPFVSLRLNFLNDEGERYNFLLSFFFSAFIGSILGFAFEKKRKQRIAVLLILIPFFFWSAAQIYTRKSENWLAAARTRDRVLSSFVSDLPDKDAFYLLAALPDNVGGAPVFRNAFLEAVGLSSSVGKVRGERVMFFTFFYPDTILTSAVSAEQGGNIWQLKNISSSKRVFTGLPEYENEFGKYALSGFRKSDHTGLEISLDFEKFSGREKLYVAFFDGEKMTFINISEKRYE